MYGRIALGALRLGAVKSHVGSNDRSERERGRGFFRSDDITAPSRSAPKCYSRLEKRHVLFCVTILM